MDVELLAIALVVIITAYPIYLVWRFLTLGIKAFKKYLYGNEYQYSPDQEEE